MTEHAPTEAEVLGHAAMRATKPPNPLLEWRLWAAITSTAAIVGLVFASWFFYRDSQGKDDAAACRAGVAAQLRDADSEVIRQTAIFKEVEGGISQGLAAIVVALGRREPTDPANIDALDRAQLALAEAKKPLDAAIGKQAAARELNLAILEKCGSA